MKALLATSFLLLGTTGAQAAVLYGPTLYLTAADSPFVSLGLQDFVLEDFEAGALAGYTASAGGRIGPGFGIDSVAPGGISYYLNVNAVEFAFAPYLAANGALPTHAGLAWTDVGFVDNAGIGVALVEFEAFDALNASLGVVSAILGDGDFRGGTDEDRFFGAFNAGGISRVIIRMPQSTDWEVDHLQFGTAPVPEPVSWAMLIGGLGLVGAAARRRVRSSVTFA